MIEILSSGASNSVQDPGRSGYLNAGVSRSGAMDREALILANRMLGNEDAAAVIEVSLFPFRVRFHQDTGFAVTGAFGTLLLNDQTLPGWWAGFARSGDVLVLNMPVSGARACLAVTGGIDTEPVLGSRSTDLKSGLGGFCGRGLNRGDLLPTGTQRAGQSPPPGPGFGLDATLLRPGFFDADKDAPLMLRVIPAAEHDLFEPAARRAFYAERYTVSAEANRQGYRLDGPVLSLSQPVELFSHGIMPGTVQVPPSGQPVIQLADANTCGGYPKIACMIEADLWKLAQSGPGRAITFAAVSHREALEARRANRILLQEAGLYAQLARRDKVRSYDK